MKTIELQKHLKVYHKQTQHENKLYQRDMVNFKQYTLCKTNYINVLEVDEKEIINFQQICNKFND